MKNLDDLYEDENLDDMYEDEYLPEPDIDAKIDDLKDQKNSDFYNLLKEI